MGNSRSYALSQARKLLRHKMATAGMRILMLPHIGEDPSWIPLELTARREPSPVRVTRKGVAKRSDKHRRAQSVWKSTSVSAPEHWFR